MLIKQIIHSKYLYIQEPIAISLILKKNINEINYKIEKDFDGSACIIAEKPKEENRKKFHVIYKSIHGFKTRTPLILLSYIGKEIVMYYDYVNALPNELFRIKALNFSINNLSGFKFALPYFTSRTFLIPYVYINEYLNETAIILRVSFNLTNELMLEKGQLRVQLVLNKSGEYWNYPLYKTTNGLTTKTIIRFINFLYENNKDPENFIYTKTIEYKNNNNGIMIFKEDL